ncbi:bifunctional [glutamate--ammonia ligase]-adenylyl-L-tyrosine phosphorylase/[glutamate--ammonia-ligase] adenylyltransferase [Candidatus Methylomicrobium oryzae]|uniref:bifunctional [glutamate--ammonia ligase]-adenylyl-L-tyrosine phosphorylase/[glutamate--ammonia-ligase] adenylyltransferase n=1 Tax=Candidatus Methylomicrobium oryzae TaxID=2802053 RepID=UPI0019207A5D|nr:bifunctional [glutamate--ammonia ligase]-adenylyl-L-tyrosine phosphorylase/[glutamate--ammonia-ligase] adenylyltransferase [Methylomicrobium sp. RS1]MBL1265600.1 bifunctional [glutamate--ammonia ligase]-adenylyl-L-tyrosine phosphorylase/[glutamate--ammonia-ligase] adenylyltransferase [Methylomicrobium sp. RS1]
MNYVESALAVPSELQAVHAAHLQKIAERLAELNLKMPDLPEVAESLPKVWCGSAFVAEQCCKSPELLIDLADSGDLTRAYAVDCYKARLDALDPDSETALMAALRKFRRREMVRIAWRDLAGWSDLPETLMDLSLLADSCIQYALDFLYRQAVAKRGTPLLKDGSPQQIVVLGMGKLGAYELNYSSDIDLIFAFPEEGVLPDRKETSYGEFFTRLCQSLVRVLDDMTVDGFVFRTDIRLRPYGDSGAVIMTFDGMENYYLTQAREWERYAMIKARQVAGDFKAGSQLMAMLQPFVYRRYLDYGAFEELRSLKQQITQELKRKDRMENVKLGPGGIREIEFIGQAFQLIRGGKEKSLQQRGIMAVLKRLGELHLLTAEDAEQLQKSYTFLRIVENHIQEYQDRQAHDLPVSPEARAALAYSLGFSGWDAFKQELDRVRKAVHEVFDQVFSLSRQENHQEAGRLIWNGSGEDAERLAACGFTDPEATRESLREFKASAAVRRLTAKGAGVLDRLMPQVLEAMREFERPDEVFKRVLDIFAAVAGRNVYLALLSENPQALALLLRLAAASPWICRYLAQYPVVFDELIDARTLFAPLKKQDLAEQLDRLLRAVGVEEMEQAMILLRQFKQQQVLKVAAADLMGAIPLMVVSDYLTYIAESIVEKTVECAWRALAQKHGHPPGSDGGRTGFGVIGLGKFGGIELGYGSDLDLVFIYDCADGNALTAGDKPISTTQFYGRLGQRVRHILDTRMLSGVLYEVDMRLRPNGDSGLLVCHINGYEDYQKSQAWTWEHQALVRGRFIAGDSRLKAKYEAVRHAVLSLPRDAEALKKEVREMREKMRAALAPKENGKFDLKQSKGGIADIEFIVQYGVLSQAAGHPSLTTYTDNIRQLDGLADAGFLSKTNAETLKAAYCAYRDYGHKLVLQDERAEIGQSEAEELSAQVELLWRQIMEA